MRILTIPNSSPGVRLYRFERALALMQDEEHEFRLFDDRMCEGAKEEDFAIWLSKYGLDWDVVWTSNHELKMQAFIDLFESRGAKTVVDVDDWFIDVPASNFARQSFRTRKTRLYTYLLEHCDRVICSTPKLQSKYGGVIAPNFVDPKEWEWPARKTKKRSECVILIPSGVGRAGDYDRIKDALQRALRMPQVKVVFMGWFPEWALTQPAGKVVWCGWAPIDIYTRIMKWIAPDIILSPLEHCEFNEAKSNLKYLESGAVGACFVGERWGEYQRTVREGETGFLASGIVEWGDVLCELASNLDRTREIAKAGTKDVLANWTWDSVRPMWEEAIYGTGISGRNHCCLDGGAAAGGHVRESEEVCGSCPECRESA